MYYHGKIIPIIALENLNTKPRDLNYSVPFLCYFCSLLSIFQRRKRLKYDRIVMQEKRSFFNAHGAQINDFN